MDVGPNLLIFYHFDTVSMPLLVVPCLSIQYICSVRYLEVQPNFTLNSAPWVEVRILKQSSRFINLRFLPWLWASASAYTSFRGTDDILTQKRLVSGKLIEQTTGWSEIYIYCVKNLITKPSMDPKSLMSWSCTSFFGKRVSTWSLKKQNNQIFSLNSMF